MLRREDEVGECGTRRTGGYDAIEHRLVFTKEEIARLIATNRDLMWNPQVQGAKSQRIDGEPAAVARSA